MKYEPLLAIALLLATAISGFSDSLSDEKQRSRLRALRGEDVKKLHPTLLDRAYLDTYRILSDDNQCSRFFGGSGSRQVVDELVLRLRKQTITDTRIGIRMWGTYASFVEPQQALAYRLFERAEINSLGAFYRAKTFLAQPFVPNIGSLRPNTREARVLLLLHELAHLIQRTDGTWLIPDDGNNPQLSRLNTLTVESKCGQLIRSL